MIFDQGWGVRQRYCSNWGKQHLPLRTGVCSKVFQFGVEEFGGRNQNLDTALLYLNCVRPELGSFETRSYVRKDS